MAYNQKKNLDISRKGNELTIKIDLSKRLGPSKSGKTVNVASTFGNEHVPDEENMYIGINCYTYE